MSQSQQRSDDVRKRRTERLVEKKQEHVVKATAYLRGDLGRKFINECLDREIAETKLAREIFSYYYDNHPNPMNY